MNNVPANPRCQDTTDFAYQMTTYGERWGPQAISAQITANLSKIRSYAQFLFMQSGGKLFGLK
jgi:hypothetical protein